MTKTLNIMFVGTIAAVLLFGAYLFIPKAASANPSDFLASCQTADSATTTLAFMTAGTGTSTLTCPIATNGRQPADSGTLAVQFTASSTGTKLNINTEYSMDGLDWYQDDLSTRATTTPAISMGSVQTYNWQFASSTPGLGVVPTTNNRDHRIITVATPMRYVRFIFTLPAGSTNGAIWAQFNAKREF